MHDSVLKDFTRGGQTTMHAIRMFVQSIRYIIFLSFVASAIVFGSLMYTKTTAYERYICVQYVQVLVKNLVENGDTKFKLASSDNRQITLTYSQFLKHRDTQRILQKLDAVFQESLNKSILSAVGILIIFIMTFQLRGQKHRARKDVRGTLLRTPKELARMLRKSGNASKIKIAGVPIKKNSETQNVSIIGTTGVGKTTAMLELMKQTRANGQKAVIYDKKGCFVEQFYRPGKDIILNPLDARSPAWNMWADCKDGADYETLAQALMPENLSASDPFWINAARTIFASACQQLKKRNQCTMRALLEPIFTDPESAASLSELLKGTVAETLVSEKIDKTALSIKATLSTYCKSLMFLKGLDEGVVDVFSIRKWLNVDDDSWLFFSVVDNLKMPLLRPLISVWLDIAARSLLTLPLNRNRRIWLYYDELGSAHKLPSLEMALSEGREYGACSVISLLDKAQLVERYGHNACNTILSLFNTNILFRTNSEDTAKWMSGLLGKHEILERRESVSMGANEIRDGVSLNEERRTEPLILDTEFTTLPDMQAYLRLPGEWPRTKVKFKFRKDVKVADSLVARDDVDLFELQANVAAHESAMQLITGETLLNKNAKPKVEERDEVLIDVRDLM